MLHYFLLNILFGFLYILIRLKTFNISLVMLLVTQTFTLPVFLLSELWVESRVIKGEMALGCDEKKGKREYYSTIMWSNTYIILLCILLSKLFNFETNIIYVGSVLVVYHFFKIGYLLKKLNDSKLFGLIDILCYLYCGYLLILNLF